MEAQFSLGRAPLHEYVNQWRPIDFRRAFESAGFEILEYSTEIKSAYNNEQTRLLYRTRVLPMRIGSRSLHQFAKVKRAKRLASFYYDSRQEAGEVTTPVAGRRINRASLGP